MMEIVCRPLTIETEPMLSWWNVGIPRVVVPPQLICPQMPFPDVTRLVPVSMQNMSKAVVVRVHSEFINRHAGTTCVFSGEKRGAVWRAHRATRNSVAEIRHLLWQARSILGVSALGHHQHSRTTGNGVDPRKHRQDSVAYWLNETSKYSSRFVMSTA